MKTLSNILQLWRFYWRTEKRMYLRLFLTIFAIYMIKIAVIDFILMHESSTAYNYSHTAIHLMIFSFGIPIILSYLFDAVHHKKAASDYLCLPASNTEKFLSRFTMGIVGVPILFYAAVGATAIIVTLFLGTMNHLAGNQPEWGRIFNYYYTSPTSTNTQNTLNGYYPFSSLLYYFLWNSMIFMLFNSFFIWLGTAFHRLGWVYATITPLALGALAGVFSGIFGIDLASIIAHTSPRTLAYLFRATSILLTLLFTVLAYRSFCRAQIVTHKFVTL